MAMLCGFEEKKHGHGHGHGHAGKERDKGRR